MHVAKRLGEQRRRPVGEAGRRLGVEQRQNTAARLGSILRLGTAVPNLTKAGKPVPSIPHPPFGCRAGGAADIARNRPRRCPGRRQQHNPRLKTRPVFGLPRTHQAQPRLRAVERLNLTLLIDRENERLVRRIEIEADDIGDLLGKIGIARQLELFFQMRPKPDSVGSHHHTEG